MTIADRVTARSVLRLAAPALPVLAAEPLYLLVDTAVIGRLGAVSLAALAVAGVVFAQITTQLTFLAYGTTARVARLYGAGHRGEAITEGVQATWLALAVGVVVLTVAQLVAEPVATALGDGGPVAEAAVSWLRIALLGAPLVLVTLAGNGWMRGIQDTVRPLRYVLAGNGLSALACPVLVHGIGPFGGLGLVGSAWANVLGQTVGAGLFLRALWQERVNASHGEVRMRPDVARMRAQLVLGRDLVLRTAAFQACFLSAAAVAARFGAAALAAHQIVLQLWMFMALVLDAVAIAAQSLVGAALGGGGATTARGVSRKVTGYGLGLGVAFGVLFAALSGVLPSVFTDDAAVLREVPVPWWFFAALQPVAGVVFAIDGVLLGAGDASFLRNATIAAATLGFLPLVWLSLAFGWGLAGIWSGLAAFMVLRLMAVLWRERSGRWIVTGPMRR